MEALLADLRLTIRQLARERGYTAVAVPTLALALGATTAVFSVVSGVLLRPLPFPAPSELVTVCERHPSVEGFCIASPPNVEDWTRASATLGQIGLARDWPLRLSGGDRPEAVAGGLATGGFFAALGVRPQLGRLIRPDEHGPAARVALLSDELWRARFGADPGVIERTIEIDGEAHVVVGVLPPGFAVPHLEWIRLWTAPPFDPRDEENRVWRGFQVVARLAPGASRQAAQAELAAIARGLGEQYPATNADWTVEVLDLRDSLVGPVRARLFVFLGAVGLVLLLGCANLANMTLARTAHRTHELAVRAALGAGRARIARLLLLESLVVSLAGAALGVLVAAWGVSLFLALAPAGIPRLAEVGVDWRVLAFALGLAGLSTLLIGGAPALRVAGTDVARQLHASRVVPSRGRGTLVAVETAIAVVLLAGAALLGRAFANLTAWDPGFRREGLAVAWTGLSSGTYRDVTAVRAVYEQALDAIRALPGVSSVSLTSAGPLFGGIEPGTARAGGEGADSTVVRWHDVGPGYFATLGTPVRAGREFTAADRAGAPPVAIVNETVARRFWPDRSPLGERLVMTEQNLEFTVVGVVADHRPFRPDAAVQPEVYWPFLQLTRGGSFVVVRAEPFTPALAAAVRNRLRAVAPELEPGRVSTLDERVAQQLVGPRFSALLLGSFAAVALLLAVIGIAGLIAYRVSHRVREIGLRMALGATTGAVVRQLVREGGVLVAVGVGAGVVGALALTRFLGAMLAGISPTDPTVFVAIVGVMLAVGLVAAWIPARRASRIDPQTALRAE
jgi:putative ABC transport system permease protein